MCYRYRTEVISVNTHLSISDYVQGEILIIEEKTIYSFLEKEDHEFDKKAFDDNQVYQDFLFWNLKSTVFGTGCT